LKLVSARLENYRSFNDTGHISFTDGINLIVGQNNCGKTALLSAIAKVFDNEKHRTPNEYRMDRLPSPTLDIELQLSGIDLEDAFFLSAGSSIYWPIYQGEEHPTGSIWPSLRAAHHILRLNRTPGTGFEHSKQPVLKGKSAPLLASAVFEIQNGAIEWRGIGPSQDNLHNVSWALWNRRTFFFEAQRYSLGEFSLGREDTLRDNASNLASVIHYLQTESPDLFDLLVSHVRDIFPTVQHLSVRSTGANFEIRTWPTRERSRIELSFELNRSGTGVSQVIAILAVIMTKSSSIIFIDEINSFLHPAAIKSLMRIINTYYSGHQYSITTHSPDIVGISGVSSIILITKEEYTSHARPLQLNEIESLRLILEELGVSGSDVLSAERIVWVEGDTEELCFPLVCQRNPNLEAVPHGVRFVSVVATGDFQARSKRIREIVFSVYRRLTENINPLLRSVKFSFDSERLTEIDKAELVREAKGDLSFLPRRNFECFLIHPAAISRFLREQLPEAMQELRAANVAACISELASQPAFSRNWTGDIRNELWVREVDGARLLELCCDKISHSQFKFTKKAHSLRLLLYIYEIEPEFLIELNDYVQSIVE
jgi:predicted ATPase